MVVVGEDDAADAGTFFLPSTDWVLKIEVLGVPS